MCTFKLSGLALGLVVTMLSANAPWLNYPAPGTPLTRDRKPDLSGKTPLTLNGKPDLSGVWAIEPPADLSKGEV